MKMVRSALVGLVTGAALAFVAALLRPRRATGYDPWSFTAADSLAPVAVAAE